MQLLANVFQSLAPVLINVYKSHRLLLLDSPCEVLTFDVASTVASNCLGHTPKELKSMPPATTNNIFMNFIHDNCSCNTLVFTDASVTSSRAGYAIFIPDLHIQSSANLSPRVSSFTLKAVLYLGLPFVLALFQRANT